MATEKICVAVRVRPAADKEETANGNGTFWKFEDNRVSLHECLGTPISGESYAFDHVFDQDCSNHRVYELLSKEIIYAAVDGFNGTVFAYGQTSSGKTYTMNGSESDPGIIHRAVKDIFTKIQLTADREFLVRISYMEIYNEEIIDLLSVESRGLAVHESLEHGIFVAGLREEIVNNAEQVLQFIQVEEDNRHSGETNMNVRSSRSHTIFRMVIESKRKIAGFNDTQSSDDIVRVSVLNLVDLAGSKHIAKAGAGGVRLNEGKQINKSLMILGNVINKLSEGGKQSAHIPYGDSKLTQILQPALGGNSKTSIICTVAPEKVHVEETKGTLQFASRVKRITNWVQVNEIPSKLLDKNEGVKGTTIYALKYLDGVVIGADSRRSSDKNGQWWDDAKKIWKVNDNVYCGLSGVEKGGKIFIQQLEANLAKSSEDRLTMAQIVDRTIDIIKKFKDDCSIHIILVIMLHGSRGVYWMTKHCCSVDLDYTVIGAGSDVAERICPKSDQELTRGNAKDLVFRALRAAKMVQIDTGGNIHLVFIEDKNDAIQVVTETARFDHSKSSVSTYHWVPNLYNINKNHQS